MPGAVAAAARNQAPVNTARRLHFEPVKSDLGWEPWIRSGAGKKQQVWRRSPAAPVEHLRPLPLLQYAVEVCQGECHAEECDEDRPTS
jgi:hypothetical protein